MAYEIKKESQGLYVYMDYATVPEAVYEMERIFRLDDNLLRYLTIRLADEFDADAAAAERSRQEEVRDVEAADGDAETETDAEDDTTESAGTAA